MHVAVKNLYFWVPKIIHDILVMTEFYHLECKAWKKSAALHTNPHFAKRIPECVMQCALLRNDTNSAWVKKYDVFL